MEMKAIADWEEWVKLAREDPERFEKERKAAIEELIMSQPLPYRHRSRQLQWKIDAIRRTSPNPLSSCIRIYSMLMDSFYGPNGLLEAINRFGSCEENEPAVFSGKAGRCLEFKKRQPPMPADN